MQRISKNFHRIVKDCLSVQKRRYLRELAQATITDGLSISGLQKLSDEEVDKIIMITGFGPWSANVLIFSLGRMFGPHLVRSGIGKICNLSDRPSEKEAALLGEPYKPYRSSVALLAWHYINNKP